MNTLQLEHTVNFKSCGCLPDCNDINYDYTIIKERFSVENQTKNEYETSATIYFADYDYPAYRRYESQGTGTLLSNIGGFLGLFLGMSVLLIVETIYFFTLRFIDDLWHKKKVTETFFQESPWMLEKPVSQKDFFHFRWFGV